MSGSRERAARKSSGAKYGMPVNASASPDSDSVSPICSAPWLWMPMMSPATASSEATRSFAMNVSALPIFISRPARRCRTLMPGT